ncbi:MAG: glycosyltransferase family 4 protein [Pseudomonadota bacterium]
MIGTELAGRGGISSVVSVLENEGFLRKHNILYLASHSDRGWFRKLLLALSSFMSVLGICALSRPLIVHVHSASRASFYRKSMLLAVARAFRCKTIFHLHGGEFQQFARLESGPLMRWWIRRTFEKSSRTIALSESWSVFIARFAPKTKISVVSNSVALSVLADPALEEAGRILFLGRVGKGKGVFELLAAASILKKSHPQIQIVFGGDGDIAALRSAAHDLQVEECVEILGWIGPAQKAQELARASVFALPSYGEGLPMAMLEAMSASKAVVVTPVGGIPEAIKDGENGLLIPPGDASALAFALKRVLDDPLLRRSLAANARKTIEQRFSTEVVTAKLSALYEELGGAAQPSNSDLPCSTCSTCCEDRLN